jgi:hypothetical protein
VAVIFGTKAVSTALLDGARANMRAVASAAGPGPAHRLDPSSSPRSSGHLFRAFSVIALQGFGGVLAVVQRELVERRGWLTREQFLEGWAVAQTLPGPNVVNLALMLGDMPAAQDAL